MTWPHINYSVPPTSHTGGQKMMSIKMRKENHCPLAPAQLASEGDLGRGSMHHWPQGTAATVTSLLPLVVLPQVCAPRSPRTPKGGSSHSGSQSHTLKDQRIEEMMWMEGRTIWWLWWDHRPWGAQRKTDRWAQLGLGRRERHHIFTKKKKSIHSSYRCKQQYCSDLLD